MANRLLREIAESFQVVFNGQPTIVTHQKGFGSFGYKEDFHVQWTFGYLDGLGEFVKVVVPDDARTFQQGTKLSPAEVQAIMDRPESGVGSFSLEQIITPPHL